VSTSTPRQPDVSDATSHGNGLAISLLIAGIVAVILGLVMHMLLPAAIAGANAAIVLGLWVGARRAQSRGRS
jgi:hypothetical protein